MYNRDEKEQKIKLFASVRSALIGYQSTQQDCLSGYKLLEFAKKGYLKSDNRFVQSILDQYETGFFTENMIPYMILRFAHTGKIYGEVK